MLIISEIKTFLGTVFGFTDELHLELFGLNVLLLFVLFETGCLLPLLMKKSMINTTTIAAT